MSRVLLPACLALVAYLVSLSASLPSSASIADPAAGVHTIRATDALLQQARDAGFVWLIQLLEWREVEPVPGEYFWEYADWLVRAAEYYGLDLVLRLDRAPEGTGPVDVARYAAFAGRVAGRYSGRVAAYVIWNEPNLSLEWNGRPPDPAGYVELLCAARQAIRAADPEALVVSAGLAPTNHADDSAVDDRLYLRAMYDDGAAACFDVLGAHPYGFAYPPDDPYGVHNGLNFARLADQRAIMVEAGDADKPVWATELGWTTESVETEQQWLRVDEQEQARYLVGAFHKAGEEWPWLQRIAVWNMSVGLAPDDEKRGYSILAGDGTPKPAYEALAETFAAVGAGEEGGAGDGRLVQILAPDVVVRLSDVDTFYPHWARPHCEAVPCRSWRGQFYVRQPGTVPWRLKMEIMQVEEPGNLVWINGQLLDPPFLPLRGRPDFASVWTAVEIPVPSALLRPGANTLEIRSSPRLPVYQLGQARFESLQFRHVRLATDF